MSEASYIPKGYYLTEDQDGQRLVKKPSSLAPASGSLDEERGRLRRNLRGLKASLEWAVSENNWEFAARYEREMKEIRAKLKTMRKPKRVNGAGCAVGPSDERTQ